MTTDRRAESPAVQGIVSGLDDDRTRTRDYRRASDKVVSQLVSDVAVLKSQMAENTAVTIEVRDILGSFKVIGRLSKWATAIAASLAGIYFAWKGVK